MQFRKLTIEDKQIIDKRLENITYYGAEYQFSYLTSWVFFNFNSMTISINDDVIFIGFLSKDDSRQMFLPPLTPLINVANAYEELKQYCFDSNLNFEVVQVPKEHIDLLKDSYTILNNKDYAEYLYSTDDLVFLKGKRFHSKKNHINTFQRLYDYDFRPYTDDDYDAVMGLFSEWEEQKSESYDIEKQVIKNMLANREKFCLLPYVLIVDKKIIGLSISEITSNNTGIVHIEKALIDYKGSYATINNLCASRVLNNTTIINRQEDMGIEGLRKAKQSYHPINMQEKWKITI